MNAPHRNLSSRPLQPVPTPERDLDDELRIPLREIELATNNFSKQNLIDKDQFEDVYKAQLFLSGQLIDVVVQRFRHGSLYMSSGRGRDKLVWDICRLSGLKHKNIVSIVGFCDEKDEVIIINEHLVNGTLDKHLPYPTLTWIQRLRICLSLANAILSDAIDRTTLNHITSSKILSDKDWEPKLLAISSGWGCDVKEGFGVLMAQVLCYRDQHLFIAHYERRTLNDNINYNLSKQMHPDSLAIFSSTAFNCLRGTQEKIDEVILGGLEKALELQLAHDNPAVATPSFSWKKVEYLKIQLDHIMLSTNNFAKEYCIGSGGYDTVYKAELDYFDKKNLLMQGENKSELPKTRGIVAIKRISNIGNDHGEDGFFAELEMLSSC